MRHRKLVGMVLTTAFAATMVTGAFAQDTNNTATNTAANAGSNAAVLGEAQVAGLSTMAGKITEVNLDEKSPSITVKNDNEEMIFYITDADLIDSVKGTPFTMSKNMVGEEVRVYYGPQVTMSLPAQSNATAVVLDNSETTANYAVVESVEKNKDGSVTIVTDNGSRLVTIAANATVTPFKTKNVTSLEDIKKGSEVAIYYNIMTLSLPAQANTDRVVILQAAPEPAATAEHSANGDQMIPARQMADTLGLELQWDGATKTVTMHKDAFSATVTIGSTEAGINKMRVVLDKAPKLINNTTYVPASFMDQVTEALK